ncbi:MAG TPA: 50S ribosomal protein L29 [Coxiellaceae bacterium]|nr:50S ribosomal protein L29 [Coxiellaceae bacterium]
MKEANDLRKKSVDELKKELKTLLSEQFALRMQNVMGEAPKSHLKRLARRNIARVKTVLNEKEKRA